MSEIKDQPIQQFLDELASSVDSLVAFWQPNNTI
jgi:hypothetical protein